MRFNLVLIYYGRAIDSTILTALNDNGTHQAQPTINPKIEVDWLLDYFYTP